MSSADKLKLTLLKMQYLSLMASTAPKAQHEPQAD